MCFQIINKKNDIIKEKQNLIDKFFEKNNGIYILGINELTNQLLKYFKENELPIQGIIDDYTYQNFYKGIPIVKMNDIKDKDSLVISCVIDGKLITALYNLRSKGVNNILSYFDLCLVEEKLNNIHYCNDNIYDIKNNKEKYKWLYMILNDDNSRKTLEYIIDFRYNFNVEAMKNFKYSLEKQYFDDLIELNENEIFVDCGGFNGETTEKFIKLCPKYEKVYYFEPVKQYFKESLNQLRSYGKIEFFNKGTYKDNAELRFSTKGSQSAISDDGEDVINVVKLDDVIKDEVTYIKMDVEGGEYDSLMGAEGIIKKYKPKLAICVYHNQKDFWRIPELVLSYNKDYKVYLRHYTEGLLETVMYFL